MKAAAFVVGPQDGAGAALSELARRLGFAAVLPYAGAAAAAAQALETPLLFFLFAAVEDVAALKPAAEAIRFCPSRKVRFSPLIYFARQPSTETIMHCIEMGFDDVVALPFTQKALGARLHRQLDRPQIYYETSSYFGPDRRDRLAGEGPDYEGRGGGQFRRLEIIRSTAEGVNVLHDDFQVVL